jgi:hypothetical protein
VTGPADPVPGDRHRFLRSRRRALAGATVALAAVAAFAALLLAPHRLASLRLGPMALAWWAAPLAGAVALGALARHADRAASRSGTRTGLAAPLVLAALWASPAVLLGLPPLLLADGTWGLYPAVALVGGATVALLLVGIPASRTAGEPGPVSALAAQRWPGAPALARSLVLAETGALLLFVWAQLAAMREVALTMGAPRGLAVAMGAAALSAAWLPDARRTRLAAVGAGAALLGLGAPLAALATVTTPVWPRAWAEVVARPRVTFREDSAWAAEGRAPQGPSRPIVLRFADEQRVGFVGPGRVTVVPAAGGALDREVKAGEEILVRRGDRLVVADGQRLRFERGRRVPDAPRSGPDWADPAVRPGGWPDLVGLGVTCVAGLLGLAPGAAFPAGGRLSVPRAAQVGGALVVGGLALTAGWSLYAAWLAPEVYAGGVAGAEIYGLPGSVAPLGAWRDAFAALAAGGLGAGTLAAVLAAVRGLAARRTGRSPRLRMAVVIGGATLLAAVAPQGAWPLLLAALGLAASTLGPAALLACWSERATARGLVAGVAAGLACFVGLAVAGVVRGAGPPGWLALLVQWPALVGPAACLGVAWLLRSRRARAPGRPLAAELGPAPGPSRRSGPSPG